MVRYEFSAIGAGYKGEESKKKEVQGKEIVKLRSLRCHVKDSQGQSVQLRASSKLKGFINLVKSVMFQY